MAGLLDSCARLAGPRIRCRTGLTVDRVRPLTINKEGSCSGGPSFVAVVKSTDLWDRHDSPHFHWLNWSRLGRILG